MCSVSAMCAIYHNHFLGYQFVKAPSFLRSRGGHPPGLEALASATDSSISTPRPGLSGAKA